MLTVIRKIDMNRSRDSEGPKYGRGRSSASNGDQAVMTPRALLSILRLGQVCQNFVFPSLLICNQALARLRLAEAVTHEDIDEAIRLVCK
jgi:DNA replicative helicase MCM subunit Mcm2 (Cdc46/Mcm family)